MVRCALTLTVYCGFHDVVMDAVPMWGVVAVVSIRARLCERAAYSPGMMCCYVSGYPLFLYSSLQGVK